MRKLIVRLFSVIALVGFASAGLAAPIVVAYPGATSTYITDLNDNGYVVGYAQVPSGGNIGYVFDGTHYIPIEFEGYAGGFTAGISNTGLITGTLFDEGGSNSYAYLSDTDLSFLQIIESGEYSTLSPRAVNDAGYIVGSAGYNSSIDPFAVVFDGTTYTRLDQPGWQTSIALDINNNGEIVGVYLDSEGRHGFITDVDMTFLTIIDDVLDGTGAAILGNNDNGDLVGNYGAPSGDFANFYFDGTHFYDILLDDIELIYVHGVNNNGDIGGTFKPSASGLGEQSGQSTLGIVFNASYIVGVPTPATLALFGLGLAGLGWLRRKKA